MNLIVNNLTKTYDGKTKALNDISFKINGGVFGLMGRNGAGKTTLMRIMATIIKPTSGKIIFDDNKDISTHTKEFRARLGYLPQNTQLMPYMNISEFLDYMCLLKGIKDKKMRKEEIERCMEIVDLKNEGKKKLAKYSGGMLRRAGIAQALLGSPDILIIDEPTTGLDPEERAYFLNLLSRISVTQTTIFSTHIVHDIEMICENICVLEKGNLMYAGSVSEILTSIQGKVWQYTGKPEDENELKKNSTVVSVTYQSGIPTFRYIADESIASGSESVSPTLEDAYIYLLGGIKR